MDKWAFPLEDGELVIRTLTVPEVESIGLAALGLVRDVTDGESIQAKEAELGGVACLVSIRGRDIPPAEAEAEVAGMRARDRDCLQEAYQEVHAADPMDVLRVLQSKRPGPQPLTWTFLIPGWDEGLDPEPEDPETPAGIRDDWMRRRTAARTAGSFTLGELTWAQKGHLAEQATQQEASSHNPFRAMSTAERLQLQASIREWRGAPIQGEQLWGDRADFTPIHRKFIQVAFHAIHGLLPGEREAFRAGKRRVQ